MRHRILMFTAVVVLISRSIAASAEPYDAALTRAVAAKEMAMDNPTPLQWQLAFERFLEVDSIAPSAETKYELGYVAAQLHQEDFAVEYYESSIELGLTGSVAAKARGFVDVHGPRMARVVIRGIAGSRVRIRGIDRGTLPFSRPVVVFAGDAQFELIEPNHAAAASRNITLVEGRLNEVDWHTGEPALVEPKRAAIPEQPSSMFVSSRMQSHKSDDSLVAQPPLARPTGDQGVSGRTAGMWLLGSGVGMLLSSGAVLAISIVKLSDRRQQLRAACDEPLPQSEDGCNFARPGRYEAAVALADDIARWRTVQGAAWIGVGVGALASVGGWAFLSRTSAPARSAARWVLTPSLGQREAYVSWRHDF